MVLVRYFAAARAVAGHEEETLDVPSGAHVAEVLAAIGNRHGAAMRSVLDRCSYLLDEVAVTSPASTVRTGSVIDVLPPFAGG